MKRTTAWDVWCPYCQRYWYMWRWTATGKASEYAPVRVCLKCGHHIGDANEMVRRSIE